MRGEIAVLKVQSLENIELTEEETLKGLKEAFEDMCKQRDEHEDKL